MRHRLLPRRFRSGVPGAQKPYVALPRPRRNRVAPSTGQPSPSRRSVNGASDQASRRRDSGFGVPLSDAAPHTARVGTPGTTHPHRCPYSVESDSPGPRAGGSLHCVAWSSTGRPTRQVFHQADGPPNACGVGSVRGSERLTLPLPAVALAGRRSLSKHRPSDNRLFWGPAPLSLARSVRAAPRPCGFPLSSLRKGGIPPRQLAVLPGADSCTAQTLSGLTALYRRRHPSSFPSQEAPLRQLSRTLDGGPAGA